MQQIQYFAIVCLCIASSGSLAAEAKRPSENLDLSHWKLTLPVSARPTGNGVAQEIEAAQVAAGYSHPLYFHLGTDGRTVFWCPVNGATTKGSDYPRTELREVLDPADDNVCWGVSGTHVLSARCRVLEVPSSQKVIVGQIHSFSGEARPLVKLQFFKGRIEALVKESPTKGGDLKLRFPEVGLDKDIDYEITMQNGLLRVVVNGATQEMNVCEKDPAWAQQTFYFKAGAYVQDNEGPASEGARVSFARIKVTHAQRSQE